MNDKLIQSYVWYQGRVFFVSTINRESSAMYCPGVYAETMVWECDPAPPHKRKDAILHQDEAPQGSIHSHIDVCRRLALTGSADLPRKGDDL